MDQLETKTETRPKICPKTVGRKFPHHCRCIYKNGHSYNQGCTCNGDPEVSCKIPFMCVVEDGSARIPDGLGIWQ
jgi:hypothetical protein